MKYMLLIHFDQEAWGKLSLTERQQIYGEHVQLAAQLTSSGQYLAGAPLAAAVDGNQRPDTRRPATRDRRAICGNTRAAWRLHAHRGQGSRRGDRHCRPRSRGVHGHGRSPDGAGWTADSAVGDASGAGVRAPRWSQFRSSCSRRSRKEYMRDTGKLPPSISTLLTS